MLNNINTPIVRLFADIQNAVAENAACATPEMERAFMVAGGKERVYFNQLATKLAGNIIAQLNDVVVEDTITVYPVAEGKNPRPSKQSLNASLKMVASYSLLMSGYTNQDIIHSAIENWLDDDSVAMSTPLDLDVVSADLIKALIDADILDSEEGQAQMDTGERFKAHGITTRIQELRLSTMQRLWDTAPPKMKPMLFPLTWYNNGTSELKNLSFNMVVSPDFIKALQIQGSTAYMVNPAIRANIKRNLNKGLYNAEEEKALDELLRLKLNTPYYFPSTPDYRGRMYARGGLTTFQGIKDIRACLDFAESHNVDEYGLFLHIANAYGHDKVSLNDRFQWVKDNHISLMTTKAPSLYAERARLAYVEYKETGRSNVICRIDGTCSGVQITSGLYLDAKTGAAVNVSLSTPEDVPQDLYGLVANAAIYNCKRATERNLLVKYNRDLTKKMIMILAYGAGEETLIDSIKEFLTSVGERTTQAKSLYKIIMSAIHENFPAVTRLNKQLQRELDLLNIDKLKYKLSDMTVKINPKNSDSLNLAGTNYTARMLGKSLPDKAALIRGIAPNFVHSLDAELLRKAIRELNCDVSAIHDDLGVHSKDVKTALMAVRKGYYEVIKAQPLESLYTGMGIAEEFEPDEDGLNLPDVLQSTYLFS